MANGWTPERRERQAEAIRRWQPWKSSSGPRTESGKDRSSRNAWKGGVRPALRQLAHVLRQHQQYLQEMENHSKVDC